MKLNCVFCACVRCLGERPAGGMNQGRPSERGDPCMAAAPQVGAVPAATGLAVKMIMRVSDGPGLTGSFIHSSGEIYLTNDFELFPVWDTREQRCIGHGPCSWGHGDT